MCPKGVGIGARLNGSRSEGVGIGRSGGDGGGRDGGGVLGSCLGGDGGVTCGVAVVSRL